MQKLYIVFVAMVVSATLFTGCGGSKYWDGSPYSERPVYGSGEGQGISRRLHDDAQTCNISDETLENVMQNVLTGSNGLVVTDVTAIYDMDGGGAADVEMTALEDGIWELKLTCK